MMMVLHRSEKCAIFVANRKILKFTTAESLVAIVALPTFSRRAVQRVTLVRNIYWSQHDNVLRMHHHGPRIGRLAFLGALQRANVDVISALYNPNMSPPARNCAHYVIKHTPTMVVTNTVVVMPHCGATLASVLPLHVKMQHRVTLALVAHCISALVDNAIPYVNLNIHPNKIVIDNDTVTIVGTDNLQPLSDVDVTHWGPLGVVDLKSNACATMLALICMAAATYAGPRPSTVAAMTSAFAHAQRATVEDVRRVAPHSCRSIAAALSPTMTIEKALVCLRSQACHNP